MSIVCQADVVATGLAPGWYGVRCIFDWGQSELDDDQARHTYEERITVWQAEHIDAAISTGSSPPDERDRASVHVNTRPGGRRRWCDSPHLRLS